MKVNKEDLRCYVVTTRDYLKEKSLKEECEDILKGGATFLQIREKNIDFNEYVNMSKEILELSKKYNIPFVVNDNVEVAVKSKADGVHIGQKDMDVKEARKLIGEDKILGVSVQNVNQAIEAEKDGADYLGVGPVFETQTKKDEDIVSLNELKKISKSVNIPVLAIGGIDDKSIYKLKDRCIDGVAVVSYIFNSNDKILRTKNLKEVADDLFTY